MHNIVSKNLAFEAYGNGKYQDALPTLAALADQGDEDALMALAWINEVGVTGTKNLGFAKLYYQRAADSGSCDALYRLGRIFRKSNDVINALAAFERGAKQEYLPCISALGILMVRTATNADQTRDGMRWLIDAAARGHFFARKEILILGLENQNSFIKTFQTWISLIYLGIAYKIECLLNKYSLKIL